MREIIQNDANNLERDGVRSTLHATTAGSGLLTYDLYEGFLRVTRCPVPDGSADFAVQLDDHFSNVAAMSKTDQYGAVFKELVAFFMPHLIETGVVAVQDGVKPKIDDRTRVALGYLLKSGHSELGEVCPDEISNNGRLPEAQGETSPEHLDLDRYADLYPEARCRDADPESFFPDVGGDVGPVKKICADCPVITKCFDAAVTNEESFGVFGGSSENDRRKIIKQLHRMYADADTWDNLDNRQRQEVLRRAGVLHPSYFSDDEGDSQLSA